MSKTMARLVAILLLLGASFGVRAQFCAGFVDVPDTDPFCTHITWMRNRAITLGCDATHYCPSEYVRRDQMAAFMYRLGFQNAFLNGGNAFGATASIGTVDNFALEVRANNQRVMRYEPDATSPNVVGGSTANTVIAGSGQTVSGGGYAGANCLEPATGTNVRPCRNAAGGGFATVAGGFANQATDSSTVGGGENNTASGPVSTVAGGRSNTASNLSSTVGGGWSHVASGQYSTVVGGEVNVASGDHSVVGGDHNTSSGEAGTVSGGAFNIASGNYATVPGGVGNEARGDHSVALGRNAVVAAAADGTFVFSDGDGATFTASAPNQFVVGASGGIGFYTNKNGSTFCRLAAGGGAWDCSSSRDVKRDFAPVDSDAVLASVAELPLTTWRFAGEPAEVRHIGPMAQDFRSAFGLGRDAESISQVDVSGVALAAIQGLNAKLEARLAAKGREIESLRGEMEALRRALATAIERAGLR